MQTIIELDRYDTQYIVIIILFEIRCYKSLRYYDLYLNRYTILIPFRVLFVQSDSILFPLDTVGLQKVINAISNDSVKSI